MDFLLSDFPLGFIMNYLTESTHSLLGRVKGITGQKNVIPIITSSATLTLTTSLVLIPLGGTEK